MSYLVLARKYRPKAFGEVAGQDVVTRTLKGAIEEGRVGHAYLFFGPRGTGKTTSARLFAKALNCVQGPTATPCGVCERCLSHDAGTEADLIEIDAASNTGVDHVRSLRDQAGYVPLSARFKVFLIDEVHMLSRAAFNALLKTLEEPPPHVKFLFATTELHKVPDTVVSRCQVMRLSPLSEDEIKGRLDEVFELEGIQAEDGVTAEIARRARGGMRDALSLADQLLALVGREPKLADAGRLAGMGSAEAIEAVLDGILAGDKVAVLSALPGREGDEPAFLDAMLTYLRTAMLLRMIGDDAPMLAETATPAARSAMGERAGAFGADRLELVLQELLHARERMGPIHMRSHARLILETTLLDLCRPEATMPLEEIVQRLAAIERGAPMPPARIQPAAPSATAGAAPKGGAPRAKAPAAPAAKAPAPEAPAPPPRAPAPAAAPPAPARQAPAPPRDEIVPARPPAGTEPKVRTNSTHDRWEGFLAELRGRSAALAHVFGRKGTMLRVAENVAPVSLRGLSGDESEALRDPANARIVQEAFVAANGDAVRMKLEIHDAAGRGGDDPFTLEIIELFGGRVEG